jgi:class 3 adenylate cyclase
MLASVVIALGALFVELDRRRGPERFLSRELVDRVVAGDLLRIAGERRTVTLLFADLRVIDGACRAARS